MATRPADLAATLSKQLGIDCSSRARVKGSGETGLSAINQETTQRQAEQERVRDPLARSERRNILQKLDLSVVCGMNSELTNLPDIRLLPAIQVECDETTFLPPAEARA
jgi:hypothetical protein